MANEDDKLFDEFYTFTDEANFTDEDLDWAKKVFKEPTDFLRLRRILQVMTPKERGLTIPSVRKFVETPITDLHGYAIETAVNTLADEKIRQTLFAFFRLLRTDMVEKKKAELEEKKKQEFEEQKRTEEYQKEKDEEAGLGKNL